MISAPFVPPVTPGKPRVRGATRGPFHRQVPDPRLVLSRAPWRRRSGRGKLHVRGCQHRVRHSEQRQIARGECVGRDGNGRQTIAMSTSDWMVLPPVSPVMVATSTRVPAPAVAKSLSKRIFVSVPLSTTRKPLPGGGVFPTRDHDRG